MTSIGLLVHEGSSPPQDPARMQRRDAHQDWMKNNLVLDIAGPAVQPNTFVPLMLRKPDDRRQLTQRWRFTEDGKLMCTHRGLYVQAKDGFSGFHRGKTNSYIFLRELTSKFGQPTTTLFFVTMKILDVYH